jgi:hypothetical protein
LPSFRAVLIDLNPKNTKENNQMAVSLGKLNDMYERVLSCLDAEFPNLPAGSSGKIAEDGFRAAYAGIQSSGSLQAGFGGSAQAGTGQRTVARKNIRDYRRKLFENASLIARQTPGFNEHFPPSSGETDDQLVTVTRAVVEKAIELKDPFILRGLTLEYLDSGNDLITAFESALDTRNEALSHKGAATGSKKTAYQTADEHFDELDLYIRNAFANQPDKINAWNNATHIERTPKKDEPVTPPTPTPTPTP